MPRHATSRPTHTAKRIAIIVIATLLAIVILGACAAIGYWYKTHSAALATCTTEQKQLATQITRLDSAITNAQPIANTTTESVTNPQTITTLKSTTASAQQNVSAWKTDSAYSCDTSSDIDTLHAHATNISNARTSAKNITNTIANDTNAVKRDIANTANAGIRYTLTIALSQAKSWLQRTEGQVTDESTRTTLQQHIDTAQRLIDGPDIITDANQYQQALQQLNSSIDTVVTANIAKLGVDCNIAKCVALTFDDGPDATNTPAVISALKKTNTVATFFSVGQHITDQTTPMLQELHTMGDPIGNHSWNHAHLRQLSRQDVHTQLTQTDEAVKTAVGEYPSMIRPPYSEWSDDVRDEAIALNASIINFDVMGFDWSHNAAQVHDAVVQWTRPGSIILLHDLHASTAQATEGIITSLKARGFTFVTIPQLIGGNPQPGYVYYSQHQVVRPGEPWRPSGEFSEQW